VTMSRASATVARGMRRVRRLISVRRVSDRLSWRVILSTIRLLRLDVRAALLAGVPGWEVDQGVIRVIGIVNRSINLLHQIILDSFFILSSWLIVWDPGGMVVISHQVRRGVRRLRLRGGQIWRAVSCQGL